MQRINWIDWAKALAACTVVFCHLPQSQEWFYYRYLQVCIITVFFFLSGYLKKDRGCDKENWRKYWHGLILPYLIWNAIVYPYWLLRYYMLHYEMPDIFHAMKPIWGALLFENNGTFTEPLNGPLWYLPAVLFMHILIDLCRKTKHQHLIMLSLCIVSFFLYAANQHWMMLHDLTPTGIFRRLPYYYIGYVLGQARLLRGSQHWRNLPLCITGFAISLLLFSWHLHENRLFIHIGLFYPINIGFLIGVIYGCKLIDHLRSTIIVNLSVGTLVIIGFHNVIIGAINYGIEHLFLTSIEICYHWYSAILISLVIVTILYPMIIICKRHAPVILGR